MSYDDEVRKRFSFHKATEVTGPQHEAVRAKCRELAFWIVDAVPDCRERSLALTELQATMMWLNAAIAYRDQS